MENFLNYLKEKIKVLEQYRNESVCNDRPDIASKLESNIDLLNEVKQNFKELCQQQKNTI